MISNRTLIFVFGVCFLTWIIGMTMIPLMDIDAAQYASISREMLVNKSYLQVYDLGRDYLDKPPMLFWLSALSMKIFGIHDWAYRLPSFLFALLAVYAVYRLALLFYQKTIAQLGALVLASSQALFLILHDVRCDTMLMGWVAFSLWQLAAWYQTRRWKYFIFGFIGIAGGMMTKGPIALMVPVFALVPHFILRREWKQFLRWEYILGMLIVGILLVPMSIGLYEQFDMHPGKLINNVPVRSGLRFYYWTQSFGRYTGENVYHEMDSFTFLLQNMLWSFLPWILCFLAGLVWAVKKIVDGKFRLGMNEECISTGGFIITYCVLARSQAQLPHYIFVVFPLAAIVTARWLYALLFTDAWMRWRKPVLVTHAVIYGLLWVALVGLMAIPFKEIPVWVMVAAIGCMVFFFALLFSRRKGMPVFLQVSLFTVIGINIFLNGFFYPHLLSYQLGNSEAKIIGQKKMDKSSVILYGIDESRALHFYGNFLFAHADSLQQLTAGQTLITRSENIPRVQQRFPYMKTIFEGEYFSVTKLTLPFLNPSERYTEVTKYAIIDLDGKP